ncbi:MAG: imidazole glycerol phosphate synthase subunit HisH [Pseudomonadota bacterium]
MRFLRRKASLVAERIALIDYGAGNLHSVHSALQAAGATGVEVTADPDFVAGADRIVLPGVGAFGACRDALFGIEGMVETLENRVLGDAMPFLGICVGMQLMAEYGLEHGTHEGLSWVAGTVEEMEPFDDIKIPHMGWNDVLPTDPNSLIEEGEAYFLHSYQFKCNQVPSSVSATTFHGRSIVAAIQSGTAIGVQFHPEKSQAYGLSFLKRFLEWKP